LPKLMAQFVPEYSICSSKCISFVPSEIICFYFDTSFFTSESPGIVISLFSII